MNMIMLSGAAVNEKEGLPTIEDIALGLSRMPRFGGQTALPFTVLDHSLLMASYIMMATEGRAPANLKLYGLMHDWHECLTGDVPRPFKTEDMKCLQEKLDNRFFESIELVLYKVDTGLVKGWDDDLISFESSCLNFGAFVEWGADRYIRREIFLAMREELMHLATAPTKVKIDVFVEYFHELVGEMRNSSGKLSAPAPQEQTS